ncbi:efflux RND transporter periplasmic adaptor subunit [Acetobacter orientalis]|uniref:efflux RND transporter periplasmic adaptor subunit n=1 Tax=Acetobacter orientalis TaxID=146474 RepID=UPI0039E7D767
MTQISNIHTPQERAKQAELLARFVAFTDRVQDVQDTPTLNFVAVNEVRNVLVYSHAALLTGDELKVKAVSGTPDFDTDGTYVRWLTDLGKSVTTEAISTFERDTVDGGKDHADLLPPHWVCIPILRHTTRYGVLLLGRHAPWHDTYELAIAQRVGKVLGQGFYGFSFQKKKIFSIKKPTLIIAIFLFLLGCLPVHSTMVGRAEIVPTNPVQIVAPFEGTVVAVGVDPNQTVQKGQILVQMDKAQVYDALIVAKQTLAASRVQYNAALETGVDDMKSRSEIGPLRDKIVSAQADVTYQQSLLDRTTLRAPNDGIALFSDRLAWTGKPVQPGEKIMIVAQPHSATLKIAIAPDGLWEVPDNASVIFYNNTRPDHSVRGTMTDRAYAPKQLGDMSSVYEFRAHLESEAQLGDEGTGKILGPRMPLALWLLRRPWQIMRVWL